MHDFLLAFLGGTLIGLAVVGYLYVNGRIAGMSGLIAQVLNPQTIFKTPALWFVLGLFVVPFSMACCKRQILNLRRVP